MPRCLVNEVTMDLISMASLGVSNSVRDHHGRTMFAVTSGYSVSEKVLLARERHLLVDLEIDVDDNRLRTDCLLACELQWHLESIVVMSHSQQHDGVI